MYSYGRYTLALPEVSSFWSIPKYLIEVLGLSGKCSCKFLRGLCGCPYKEIPTLLVSVLEAKL